MVEKVTENVSAYLMLNTISHVCRAVKLIKLRESRTPRNTSTGSSRNDHFNTFRKNRRALILCLRSTIRIDETRCGEPQKHSILLKMIMW